MKLWTWMMLVAILAVYGITFTHDLPVKPVPAPPTEPAPLHPVR